ncbi:type VI secretion system domain-containing protein [Pseudomonas aeruginosa]
MELEASPRARAPFWFDGQRLVWECLQGLNAEQAMRRSRNAFRLAPAASAGAAWIGLRFHDGSAFADAATRGWDQRVMPCPISRTTGAPRKVETVACRPNGTSPPGRGPAGCCARTAWRGGGTGVEVGMKRAHGGARPGSSGN